MGREMAQVVDDLDAAVVEEIDCVTEGGEWLSRELNILGTFDVVRRQ